MHLFMIYSNSECKRVPILTCNTRKILTKHVRSANTFVWWYPMGLGHNTWAYGPMLFLTALYSSHMRRLSPSCSALSGRSSSKSMLIPSRWCSCMNAICSRTQLCRKCSLVRFLPGNDTERTMLIIVQCRRLLNYFLALHSQIMN